MTIRLTSLLLIGTETDVSLQQRSNLLKSNYVKLAGFPLTVDCEINRTAEETRYDPQYESVKTLGTD